MVFCNKTSLDAFRSKGHPGGIGINYLDFDSQAPEDWRQKYNKNIIFYKKWWALYHLGDAYEYYLMCDSEMVFVKSFDVYAWAKQYFDVDRTFYARRAGNACCDAINRDSSWRYSPEEIERISALTKDRKLYYWFNEVPLIETSSALEYLKMLPGKPSQSDGFGEFDWLSYSFYLLLNRGFKIVDVEDHVKFVAGPDQYSIGERGGGPPEVVQLMKPHWALYGAWELDRAKFEGCDVFLAFHLDRSYDRTYFERPNDW